MKAKVDAKAPDKSASAPALERQPERREQQGGPLPDARAAGLMAAPERGPGTVGRARIAQHMQRSAGNARLGRLLGAPVQTKLTVGAPGDVYEQEAERVADQVMRMGEPAPRERQEASATALPLRRAPEGAGAPEVTPAVEQHIGATRGGGEPLPEQARATLEPRFGADFGGVRVHHDAPAQQAARALSAQAFTTGQDIYFGAGRYQPGTGAGDRLLAHELTHVVQQQPDDTARKAVPSISRQRSGPAIQLSPLSAELQQVLLSEGKGPLLQRLRNLGMSDPDVHSFVEANLTGDDLWLARNLLTYGPEAGWPIHLRVERELKGWADTGGVGAVFNILRAANGAEAGNAPLKGVLTSRLAAGSGDLWLAQTLQAYGPEAGWPIHLSLEQRLRASDKARFFADVGSLSGGRAGDTTIRNAFNSFVASGHLTWTEAFHAAALLELGPQRNWPQLVKNFDEGLATGAFTMTALPPAGAEALRQFCIIQAGQAAEGSGLPALYRNRFNALWDAPPHSTLPADFDRTLDSKGPRNRRARSIFATLYAGPAIRAAYDADSPPGFRELCDTYMGPDSVNLIASPRLQRLRALLNPPAVTATGTADAPYVALAGLVRAAAAALDSADRQQVRLRQAWRLTSDAKVAGATTAVTRVLRDDLWTIVTTSRPVSPPSAPATPSAPPTPEAPPTLDSPKRAWLAGITLTAPASPVKASRDQQDLTFQVKSSTPNPGLAVRRHVTVEPAEQVITGQDDQAPWPTGSRSVPHTAQVDPDTGGPPSRVFTSRLRMPPVPGTDFAEKTATVTVEDKRQDWFASSISIGASYSDENVTTQLVPGSTVHYFGGQLALTVQPYLPDANPGLPITMEGEIKKSGASIHTFKRMPFGPNARFDKLGSYIEREKATAPPGEPMEIIVSFFRSGGPPFKTLSLAFNVARGLPVAPGADAAILAADNLALVRPASVSGSLLHYMTTRFPPNSPHSRVAKAVASGAIQVEAVIVRSDSAAWLAANGGNPANEVAYACGNMSNARVLKEKPGAIGWQWPAFPNHVFLNLTPRTHAPGTKRSNEKMADLLAHEGIHAADRIEPGVLGRYSTEFRAYWIMGLGAGKSTAPDPTMSGKGPKSPRARAIFEFLYNSPLYGPYTRPNYDDNINHFRERVDTMLVPDGINLALSGNLQALRAEIESYTGPAAFAAKHAAILARYATCTADDKVEITGNRAWRQLVDSKFTLPAHAAQIKTILAIPQ